MVSIKWEYIMLHHSLTEDGKTVSWQAIRRYHIQEQKWLDVGYHFGIELVNNEYEILVGRPLDMAGAHCKEMEMNRKAIGICLVGNFDIITPPDEQWKKATRFVASLCKVLQIPTVNIVGHRNFATYKSCPGKFFDLEKFRMDVLKFL